MSDIISIIGDKMKKLVKKEEKKAKKAVEKELKDVPECKFNTDKFLNSGIVNTLTDNITNSMIGYLKGFNDMNCFKKKIKAVKPNIINHKIIL